MTRTADPGWIIDSMSGKQHVYPTRMTWTGNTGTGTSHYRAYARRAYWDGAKLVTEGAGTVQGQTVSIRATRTLNPAATEMTVESMVAVQHGYTLRGAQTYVMVKDVYTRTAT